MKSGGELIYTQHPNLSEMGTGKNHPCPSLKIRRGVSEILME
jgi:hypothetical protein